MEKYLPICVDIDGTLVTTDTTYELMVKALKEQPSLLLRYPLWIMSGKSGFKHMLHTVAAVDPTVLPYNEDVLAWLRSQKEAGRKLYLATASHRATGDTIAAYLGIFDGVIGTTDGINAGGSTKAKLLNDAFGNKQYIYAGNSMRDVDVWQHAAQGVVVQAPPNVIAAAKQTTTITKIFPDTRGNAWYALWKTMRAHQWVKNILVLIPLIAAHSFANPTLWERAVTGFIAFCCIASGVYIVNDLFDTEADRKHPHKKHRPLASGQLPILTAFSGAAVLLAAGGILGAYLSQLFFIVLAVYVVINVGYSTFIKQFRLVDVAIISTLYMLRLGAGSAATGIPISIWLLAFIGFGTLSLAFIKRYIEVASIPDNTASLSSGRPYTKNDIVSLRALGRASGWISAGVLAVYTISDTASVLYSRPALLLVVVGAYVVWLNHMWELARLHNIQEDPIAFGLKDTSTYAVVTIALFAVLVAT